MQSVVLQGVIAFESVLKNTASPFTHAATVKNPWALATGLVGRKNATQRKTGRYKALRRV